MPRVPIRLELAALVLLACDLAGATPPSIRVELRGRSRAPGELLQVRAASDAPLRRLEATFLGRAVFMSALERDSTREIWLGWSMIDLERGPGTHALTLQGETLDGRAVSASLDVVVEAKEFPTESLEVAESYVEPPPEVRERREREQARLAEIFRQRSPVPAPTTPFVRPVDGPPTSIFGTRRLFNGKPRSPHPGLDLRAGVGTNVQASGPGRVVLAQELYFAGNTVILDHGGGLFTLYAHLAEIAVEEGQELPAGRIVGRSGATGRVTGPHLHWGAKIGDQPFDPSGLLERSLYGLSTASAH